MQATELWYERATRKGEPEAPDVGWGGDTSAVLSNHPMLVLQDASLGS